MRPMILWTICVCVHIRACVRVCVGEAGGGGRAGKDVEPWRGSKEGRQAGGLGRGEKDEDGKSQEE